MIITITRDHYTLTSDLVDYADPDAMPKVDEAIEACCFLLTFFYKAEDIMKAAREWEI
jgi:hypothetical protein